MAPTQTTQRDQTCTVADQTFTIDLTLRYDNYEETEIILPIAITQ